MVNNLLLRPTCEADFEALFAIEREAFPHPWPREAFSDFLLPWAWTLLYLDEAVGYVFYQGVGDEMVIINIAIRPCYHGRGWGEYMLQESMQQLIDNGVTHFYLDVRSSNGKARALYDKFGFVPIGVRKNYYSSPEEDAIVMGKVVG